MTPVGPRLLGLHVHFGNVTSARMTWASTTLDRQSCSRPSWRCCSWQDAVGGFFLLPFYWLIVVLIRAAATAVGDFISGRNMLGLPVSTALMGLSSLPSWSSEGSSRDRREIAFAS